MVTFGVKTLLAEMLHLTVTHYSNTVIVHVFLSGVIHRTSRVLTVVVESIKNLITSH